MGNTPDIVQSSSSYQWLPWDIMTNTTGIIDSIYPRLKDREPLPGFFGPLFFLLTILPFLISNKTIGVWISLPILIAMLVQIPAYTFGDPSSDYYNSGPFLAMFLGYIDFVLLTPRDGPDAPAYVGKSGVNAGKVERWVDVSPKNRIFWAARLMLPAHRGIGWNWQVKSVPRDPDASRGRLKYAASHLSWATFCYLQSFLMLVVLGFSRSLTEYAMARNPWLPAVTNALVGWSGAIWVWHRLCCAYSLCAAFTVAVGMFQAWEWPPLMGQLSDAWSVRQMWGAVYHQTFRRMLSKPSILFARGLGLRKGSLASRYSQLLVTFYFSYLLHRFQMLNVARKDMGEFSFFMSQVVAILIEDIVQYLWRFLRKSGPLTPFERRAGYFWTIIWFSFSLCFYINGLCEAKVIMDWLAGDKPLHFGHYLANGLVQLVSRN